MTPVLEPTRADKMRANFPHRRRLSRPDTIIVVAPELASFYELVKVRQEAEYGSVVVC